MTSIKEKLYRPFENLPTRKGRGGVYTYVRWRDVVDRMNEIFGIRWSSQVTFQEIINDNVIIRVSVCVKDPDTGLDFCQEGFGGAILGNDEAGNPFKAAYSKALKDACKKWGIGLYLDEEDEDYQGNKSIPSGYQGKEYGTPSPPSSPPSNTPAKEPDIPMSNGRIMPSPPFPMPPKNEAEKQPTTPTPPTERTQSQPAATMIPPKSNEQVAGVSNIPMPPTMPVPTSVKAPTASDGFEKPQLINDIQKAAINHILKVSGNREVDELIKEAFNHFNWDQSKGLPKIDDLTYDKAMDIVKFGNDHFINTRRG